MNSQPERLLLDVRNVSMRFGGLTAVKELIMEVPRGALYGLIGPNGAGKTTIFNVLTGVYTPTNGEVYFDGDRIDGHKPHEITRRGIARTFQNIRLFSGMTVLENVMTANHLRSHQWLADAVLRTERHTSEEQAFYVRAMALLKFFNLEGLAHEDATSLPYGNQRRLEIARALATSPKLLLLDEPAAGMNPAEALELVRLIRRLRDELHLTILIVEHNMKVIMNICETIQVVDHGETIEVGPPAAIQASERVIEAYLGDT